ncbi:uncharacterized protein LOC131659817 [Vicia villosa]|uniref:uncharacterized protein LOC131659817 n=1 Tax=Vicia villosa TaxID=3911 RepID=UPI00273BA714|nr:uncharacterized protein LOC131659817 [Vicia villosa]
MANSVTVNKKTTKHTFSCSFYREDITPLVRLSTRVTGQNLDEFRKTYGHILLMLTTRIDEWGLYTLLQFYDSELRCFTFQDYQLAPTLEEYAHILQIKVPHKVPFVCAPEKPKLDRIAGALYLSMKDVKDNWKPNGGTHGFYVKFLMREAETLADKEKWKEFNALLAVMIYGLVMFPNIPNFVDLTAICLFMDQNPVPTLLADTYYAIHSRYGKKGSVGGCLPILYEWFSSHLPKSGAFVTTRDSQKWPQRIMGLTANDIVWYHLRTDIEQVITRCGSFGNVPLIGTKGVINYNPKLALRQLGFAMKDKPSEKEIFESVCFEKGTDPEGLEKVRSAWNKIHTEDRTTLGGKNAIAKKAYTEWVEERVKERLLPFPKVSPLYEQPPEILTATVPAEEYNQVHVENIRLREKGEDAKIKYFLVDQKRAELAHEVIEEAVKKAEEKLKQEYREDLRAHKLRVEKEARAEVKGLKKKLEEETTQRVAIKKKLEEEITQRLAVETQLKGSHLRSARLTEENAKLRNQIAEMESTSEKNTLPDCKGCESLVAHCDMLDGQLFRKDVMD